MSAPVQLNPHKSGDYWPGLPSVAIRVDGEPLNLAGATILLQFKRYPSDAVAALALTNIGGSPGIIATDPGVFVVSGRTITLKPGAYFWDIQITSDSKPETYASGTWQITPDVSR